MKFLSLFLISVLIFLNFWGCTQKDDLISTPIDLLVDTYNNIPVKVNTQNSFTFTVNAKNFSYSTQDDLIFLNDSLVVTITMTGVTSDNSTFQIFNDSGQEFFSESLNEGKVVVNTDLVGNIPDRVSISLVNFTGQLTIVIALNEEWD